MAQGAGHGGSRSALDGSFGIRPPHFGAADVGHEPRHQRQHAECSRYGQDESGQRVVHRDPPYLLAIRGVNSLTAWSDSFAVICKLYAT